MKLWGKVASGLMLVMAAGFVVVAVMVAEERWKFIAAAIALVAGALYGIPLIVRLFMMFTGDEEVLENGIAGTATIRSLDDTGWRFNDQYPIFKFSLDVEAGGAVYPVEIKQAATPEALARLDAGAVVAVRVHRSYPKKVVIDWREPLGAGAPPAATASVQEQTSAAQPSEQPAKNSLWPFLRWGFLLFGLVFLRLSCEEAVFEKRGVAAQAVVIEKIYTPGRESTSHTQGRASRHSVRYRFTTQEGRTVQGAYDVLPQTWQQLKVGDPIAIEYLPGAPDTNRVPDQRARSGIWRIMALVILAGSGVLFILRWRERPAQAMS